MLMKYKDLGKVLSKNEMKKVAGGKVLYCEPIGALVSNANQCCTKYAIGNPPVCAENPRA
jgi:hypothetical protein